MFYKYLMFYHYALQIYLVFGLIQIIRQSVNTNSYKKIHSVCADQKDVLTSTSEQRGLLFATSYWKPLKQKGNDWGFVRYSNNKRNFEWCCL